MLCFPLGKPLSRHASIPSSFLLVIWYNLLHDSFVLSAFQSPSVAAVLMLFYSLWQPLSKYLQRRQGIGPRPLWLSVLRPSRQSSLLDRHVFVLFENSDFLFWFEIGESISLGCFYFYAPPPPPAWTVRRGHLVFGSFVRSSVCPFARNSVTLTKCNIQSLDGHTVTKFGR